MEMYLVGGAVRDMLLGQESKDYDFSVEAGSFQEMRDGLEEMGFKIFLETPEFLTIRARFPSRPFYFAGRQMATTTCDFVLCRKDGQYTDGRRPDEVIPGNIYDDLARRDFTMNAIALTKDGRIIDPFCGTLAIEGKYIKAVGKPMDRLREDSLRALRALRFSVTKGFMLDSNLMLALNSTEMPGLLENVSQERIREELHKMFRHDTFYSLSRLEQFPQIRAVVLKEIWLKPTLEKR